MRNRLEFLKRQQAGKLRLEYYKKHFNDFGEFVYIDLENSELLLSSLDYSNIENEVIKSVDSFIDSDLLRGIYKSVNSTSKSYMFTDDFEYCGLFLVNTKEAIEKSLHIAQEDENHTVFILDSNKVFFIRINFYDQSHKETPLTYDIRVSRNK